MAKLTDRACANTKPQSDRDVLLGDGDGLYLRIRPGGARVWIVDYVVKGARKKASIGNFDSKGGRSQTIDGLLEDGVLSLAQARLVASEWKKLRRLGIDPVAERAQKKAAEEAIIQAELAQPTVLKPLKNSCRSTLRVRKVPPPHIIGLNVLARAEN